MPGSVRRQISGSTVGIDTVIDTLAWRAASLSTSMSRTMSGPRVIRWSGVRCAASWPMQARVSRNRPSAGWYGSVAVPTATRSAFQDGRPSSRPSTSAMFVFTRIDVP